MNQVRRRENFGLDLYWKFEIDTFDADTRGFVIVRHDAAVAWWALVL